MPLCKNDPKRKYKGDEPSPKGIGWCAHSEKEGKVRKGRDGNKWITKKVSSGSLRWVKSAGDSKPIKISVKKNTVKTNYVKKVKSSVVKNSHVGFNKYYTHYNGTRPRLVDVSKKIVRIYQQSDNNDDYTFTKEYKVLKVFIGKSPKNGKKFDGNTILLQIGKYKYVYISYDIEEFSTPDDIISYYSPVGNNDVPYPIAFSKNNTYIFNDLYLLNSVKYMANNDFFDKKYKTEKQKLEYSSDNYFKLEPFFTSVHYNENPKISLQKFNEIRHKTIDDVSIKDLKTILKMYAVTTSGSNKQELVDRLKNVRQIDLFNRSFINKVKSLFGK